jgi:mono/diheme cytochrome c family protein
MAKTRTHTARKATPRLVRLRYGVGRYCELCGDAIVVGDLVAWWPVTRPGGRRMVTAYCAGCHQANARAGQALR